MLLKWDLYVYTIIMFITQISHATTITMFWPMMVDMSHIFNTTINMIAWYITFNAAGYLIGSLFGLLYNVINRQLVVTAVLTVTAIATILVPFCPNLLALYFCQLFMGLGGGLWDNAVNVWLIEIWRNKCAPILHFSQFMFGIGTIFGPLIALSYTTGEVENNGLNGDYSGYYDDSRGLFDDNSYTAGITVNHWEYNYRRESLKTPFIINGIMILLGAVLFAAMFFVKRYEPPMIILNNGEEIEEESRAESPNHGVSKNFQVIAIALMAIVFASNVAMVWSYFVYGSTFNQYADVRLYVSEAAEVMSAMTATFTVGAAISVVIAFRLKPEYMLAYHYIIIFVAVVLILIAPYSYSVIWTANIIIGFGFSAIWASSCAFLRQHIKVTDRIGTILVFCGGIPRLISPLILGTYIRHYPIILIGWIMAFLLLSVIAFSLLNVFIIRFKRKNEVFETNISTNNIENINNLTVPKT